MSDKSKIFVKRVFELMDQWRHLPDYQLERRADIFFALFLPEVLKDHLGLDQEPYLIPEFPIKNRHNNQSSKVDYLALERPKSGMPDRAFLVELKTDMASRRPEQDAVLNSAIERGACSLIDDVITIARVSEAKKKYVHLLFHLKEAKLVRYGQENDEYLYKKALEGDYEILKGVERASWVSGHKPKLESLYIQPEPPPAVVDFRKFACIVEKGQGCEKIRRLFATYVRTWAGTKAGESNPLASRP